MNIKQGILEELESIKQGFKDAYETDGYDLANENFHLENAIALVKKLTIPDVVKSLPIQDLLNCTRVEVIDQKGRSYVNWQPTNKVRLSMQDDGRTAKIFID